ncbi:MAG: glycosyltransferase family 8 protein, partial [bacterium]|nr:glycosyltransferase family 8 protein [bacterium]
EIDYAPRCTFDICLVDKAKFDEFPLPIEHITQEMYYRFLLPNLLTNEKRTIYMDVDILAMNDITPLWKYDLKGAYMAGVAEEKNETFAHYKISLGMHPASDYFNSGVLVMDLEKLREIDFETKCMTLTAEMHDRIAWPDQDVINLVLEGKICTLPRCYNCMPPKLMKNKKEIVLRHYANFSSKPWCYLWKNQSWYPYLKYLRKTPFKKNAWGFIWAHIKGFFWYTYTKKGVRRTLCLGVPVYKKKV